MNWTLLFTDLSARLIGLFGLFATALLITTNTWIEPDGIWTGEAHYARLIPAIALVGFVFGLSLTFLLPNLHDRILRRTIAMPQRSVFVILCLVWLTTSLLILFSSLAAGHPLLHPIIPQKIWFVFLAVSFTAFGWTIFPRPLAYREARKSLVVETHFPTLAPHQRQEIQAVAEHAIQASLAAEYSLRRKDIWDYLLALPVLSTLIASVIAFRFGGTTQTADLDALLDANLLRGIILVGVVFILPMMLNALLRRPTDLFNARQSPFRRRCAAILGIPILAVALFAFAAYDGFPTAWNIVTDNPEGTVTYEVIEVETRKFMSGCVSLNPIDQPQRGMMNCGLDSTLVNQLAPGRVLEVIGELSRFGHTFDVVRIIR